MEGAMKFTRIFEIRLQRSGVSPTPITGDTLILQPTASDASGVRALERHRLLVRPQVDGLMVLTGLAEDSQPFIPFDDLTLLFELVRRDPMVGYVLDLSTLRPLRQPTFKNLPPALELQLGEHNGLVAEGSASNARLAWVEIGSISSGWALAPRRFVLELQPRQVRWVYYIVTKRSDKPPSISDSVPSRAFDFDATPLAAASTETAQDRVAQALVAENPDAKVYRLSSKRSPPTDGSVLMGLRLQLDGQNYISDLPPPPSDQLMNLPVLNSQPQDALYRIIRL
jgi:hypothetical protein